MSKEERSSLVSLLVNLGVDTFIILKLYGLWKIGAFEGAEGLQNWARAVLWCVPLAIGGTILLTVLGNIFQGMISGESTLGSLSDERDRQYQLRGMATTMVLATFGVLGGVVTLALGYSAIFGLTVIWFSMAAGALAGDIVRLLSYRVWG